MNLLRPAKLFLSISAVLVVTSIVLLVVPGPKISIDFTGGTLVEVQMPEGKTKEDLRLTIDEVALEVPLGNVMLSATKGGSVLMRMRGLSNEEHLSLIDQIEASVGVVTEKQFTTIGPTVGATLKKRAILAILIAAAAIILYIAFAFRKVPKQLSPWRFGVIAVITLFHDVIITVGVFVIISQFTSFEFDTLFITALLTILGYSVNDTIVIFDRIRDNLSTQQRKEPFIDIASKSLNQSIQRSINTSVSTLIMLSTLFILGSESIKWFVLTLIVGAIIGTYSSIFLATPLLVIWRKRLGMK
ncbi:protein translocase subunit SecF [Candidatus Peregrinibacteria bacterium]|jgi:preprotein translocase subunit SecF|nr:protein translocase subunit SecF [Candidatus Peregrinibacteria bacterium]MBT3599127.1 protein translocase subunit SecF [Candidatus Peregrinibacteria bacterium]MBT4366952.1 protein translocase subunit SecF [Candidatus Peregrinibacteria bacterium]MBT4585973.1 protein translocase subunit SecF [Candidatus Peregrinibacteria bacterium]MBT6730767.1 protein translocase subunit SecF [Candidatus Peregrinibacteria bacterium]